MRKSSRFPGFYKLSAAARVQMVSEWAGLNAEDQEVLLNGGLSTEQAAQMIENGIGTHAIPLGIAVNFVINDEPRLIPMAIEEPSVLAAVSNAAKMISAGGGFHAEASEPVMIGQIQVLDIPDLDAAVRAIEASRERLMEMANETSQNIVRRGGGARDIVARPFPETPVGPMLVVHLHYDCRDAMGANAVNTAVEYLAPTVAELTDGRTNLRILSNLTDQRTATARCRIPANALTKNGNGKEAARAIVEANAFAIVDPYRAATHNKGIMNGIDAVCIATGNDWRAIEAGAHAFAANSSRNKTGGYSSLTDWHQDDNGDLVGEITLPLAVGTVGGATKVHPTAQVAMKILDVSSAGELAAIMACVGLAQNLAAIRALATVGIQQGHMRMHARQVAMAAGATGKQVDTIANLLVQEKNIRVNRAQELLQ
ncbi:MAG: hydroxymethylglutaryl-CoA reductase, degradative [Chloroflexota bacterium]